MIPMVPILKIYFGDIMSHLKSCSRCGRFHQRDFVCLKGKKYKGGVARDLRKRHVWDLKRNEIKEASNWLCEVCRHNGRYSYDGLSVHHIVKIRDDPERFLDNYNLICLCQLCHKDAENGVLDPNFLFDLAKGREKGRYDTTAPD